MTLWAISRRRGAHSYNEKVAAQAAERNPMNELRELMALCQHEIWSHWMEYLFSVSTYNRDGSVTIPPNKVARWAEQLKTHYVLLSEQEKEADREQADRVLVALAEYRENTRAVESFFERVCRRAEANMEKTGTLEGAHYAAMRTELAAMRD